MNCSLFKLHKYYILDLVMSMKKIVLIMTTIVLGISNFITGCSCKKDIDPGKAYEYLKTAHNNLKQYYKGNFSVVSEYKYDIENSTRLLSTANESIDSEYSVVLTGNSDEKKFGEYVFNDEKMLQSRYNDNDIVVSVSDENFDEKETFMNAYDTFIDSLYKDHNSQNINEYIINEAQKVLENEFLDKTISFTGEFSNLVINSFLQKDIFTIDYTYSHEVLINGQSTSLLVTGKLQFSDREMLYTYIEMDFKVDGKLYNIEISHKYKDIFIDPNQGDNGISGLKSMLDIDINFFKKLEDHERSFALVLYSKNCSHCLDFANSFNYSKNVLYKLEISDFTQEDLDYISSNIIDYANDNNLPSNSSGHSLATPAIIRFENGLPKYISYGNVGFENKYNYDLLVSIIEGTFTGQSIEYQDAN